MGSEVLVGGMRRGEDYERRGRWSEAAGWHLMVAIEVEVELALGVYIFLTV